MVFLTTHEILIAWMLGWSRNTVYAVVLLHTNELPDIAVPWDWIHSGDMNCQDWDPSLQKIKIPEKKE